jgi:ATP-binding cassette subfamily C (CFTR/MRP) protein 1
MMLTISFSRLSSVINSIVEASLSIDRVGSFLLSKEHKPIGPNNLEENGVQMQMVSAAYDSKKPKASTNEERKIIDREWEVALLKSLNRHADQRIHSLLKKQDSLDTEQQETDNLLALKRIDFECKPGEFVAVVGGVGCGKSSLVNAILGEVREVSGKTSVCGKLAYFSQSPFILNASVRDNILFGHVDQAVDEELYQRSLDVCALRRDLELLPFGDTTEIGEKGITLSGGQKARVALARAVYHQADITLIDDALSAVDAHVAEHLFEKAIAGELMSKTDGPSKRSVILVTNAIQYLNHGRVDRIVVLNEGEIVEQGTYKELAGDSASAFSRFLAIVEETGVSEEDMGGLEGEGAHGTPVTFKRRASSVTEPEVLKPQKLMTEEARATGHVDWDVYKSWFKAAGGLYIPIVVFIVFSGDAGMSVLSNWWLTYWSDSGSGKSQNYFLLMYGLINLGVALVSLIRSLFLAFVALTASRAMFDDMLGTVMHAPMSFFDTTPVGRLVNRFSKDIYTIDEKLVETGGTYIKTIFSVVSTIAVISGVTPIFILFMIPMILYYMKEQAFFTVSDRSTPCLVGSCSVFSL